MYYCKECDYETNKQTNYNRHCNTNKHKKNMNELIIHPYGCNKCQKKYKYLSGLKYHQKKCNDIKSIVENALQTHSNDILSIIESQDKHEIIKLKQDLQNHSSKIISLFDREENKEITKLKSELREKQNEIDRLIPLIGNKTNNFNLNIFLNDECKDALNWDDFVKQLSFTFNADNSITDDISNIICSSIDALGLYKRPIHCLDLKRKKLCIKNGDEWDKNPKIDMLKKTTERVQNKYRYVLDDWEALHPKWYESETESVVFLQLNKKFGDSIDFQKCMNKIMKSSIVPKPKHLINE
jgi:hypothetical protein